MAPVDPKFNLVQQKFIEDFLAEPKPRDRRVKPGEPCKQMNEVLRVQEREHSEEGAQRT